MGLLKLLLKTAFQGVFWVFLLSLEWQGTRLFEHAHKYLAVAATTKLVQQELNTQWKQASQSVSQLLRQRSGLETTTKYL